MADYRSSTARTVMTPDKCCVDAWTMASTDSACSHDCTACHCNKEVSKLSASGTSKTPSASEDAAYDVWIGLCRHRSRILARCELPTHVMHKVVRIDATICFSACHWTMRDTKEMGRKMKTVCGKFVNAASAAAHACTGRQYLPHPHSHHRRV